MKYLFLSIAIVLGGILTGCAPSESVKQAALPDADTAKSASVKIVELPTQPRLPAAERKEQGFVTHSDTIEAQVVSQRPDSIRPAPIPVAAEVKPVPAEMKRYFALQIGAFQQEANAGRVADIFRKRSDNAVNQFYDASVKLYRILVGTFTTKEDAAAFQIQLKKDYPKDYSESWVAEVKE